MARWSWLILGVAAVASPAAAASCKFTYSDAFKQSVALPQAQKAVGGDLAPWDLDKPLVHIRGQAVRLIFRMVPDPNKMDCPYLVMRIEDCGRGAARASVEAWQNALFEKK